MPMDFRPSSLATHGKSIPAQPKQSAPALANRFSRFQSALMFHPKPGVPVRSNSAAPLKSKIVAMPATAKTSSSVMAPWISFRLFTIASLRSETNSRSRP